MSNPSNHHITVSLLKKAFDIFSFKVLLRYLDYWLLAQNTQRFRDNSFIVGI